jgi:hypothetical protein
VNEAAQKHAAGVEKETLDPKKAYARFGPPPWPAPCPDEFPGD